MCGIVGLFLKDKSLEPKLGEMLTEMLITMTDRGPDSAGIAIYSGEGSGQGKLTVQADHPEVFDTLAGDVSAAIGADVGFERKNSHAVVSVPGDKLAEARAYLRESHPGLRIMSGGASVEIY